MNFNVSTKLHNKVPTVLDITCPSSNGKGTSTTGGQVQLQWMAVGSKGQGSYTFSDQKFKDFSRTFKGQILKFQGPLFHLRRRIYTWK